MIRVVRDDSAVRGDNAAQSGKNLRGDLYAVGAGGMFQSAEERAFLALMFGDEFAHLVDGVNAAEVAVALRHAPGEEAVAAQQNSVDAGIFADGFFDEQGQFEAGALPGNPDDFAAEFAIELFELALGRWRWRRGRWPNPDEDGRHVGMEEARGAACRWKQRRDFLRKRKADRS